MNPWTNQATATRAIAAVLLATLGSVAVADGGRLESHDADAVVARSTLEFVELFAQGGGSTTAAQARIASVNRKRVEDVVNGVVNELELEHSDPGRYSFIVGREKKVRIFFFGSSAGQGKLHLLDGRTPDVHWQDGLGLGLSIGSEQANVLIIARGVDSLEQLHRSYGRLVELEFPPPPDFSVDRYKGAGTDIAVIRYATGGGELDLTLFDAVRLCENVGCTPTGVDDS